MIRAQKKKETKYKLKKTNLNQKYLKKSLNKQTKWGHQFSLKTKQKNIKNEI